MKTAHAIWASGAYIAVLVRRLTDAIRGAVRGEIWRAAEFLRRETLRYVLEQDSRWRKALGKKQQAW